ncbi:MAG: hypothetical protein QOE63_193 [Acidimicrobiaceae bacterium]
MPAHLRLVVVAVVLLVAVVVLAAPAAADAVSYRPPVDAPVLDPFRPPPGPYAAGNRGIEYDTATGTAVTAAADGEVAFAGVVANERWVTVRHADGLRTTVGPLLDIAVAAGEQVVQGQPLGRAAGPLTFTVRRGDVYLDPASVLTPGPPSVHLAPDGAAAAGVASRSITGGSLDPTLLARLAALADRASRVPAFSMPGFEVAAAGALTTWWQQRGNCTPFSVEPPPPPIPRVAVLVGGLGSSSTEAGIDAVPMAALGYPAGGSVRFSYRGGRIPGAAQPALAAISAAPYDAADTLGDIAEAGDRLAGLLVAVADAIDPTTPIDLLAHSQGGLVARFALARLADDRPDVLGRLGLFVTYATPHHGAPLAALVSRLDRVAPAGLAFDAAAAASGTGIDPGSVAVAELAPGSATMARLDRTPLPPGLPVLSIAARADLVVPAARAHLDGATNVIVPVSGIDDHGGLPGTPAASHEVALALAGLPPTCTSALDAVTDAVVSRVVDTLERGGMG